MKKNISVIMANYNHSKYLNDRIESFAKQIHKPLEIIIVDDKSTDESVRILEKLKKKYKFLKILKNTKNLGANKSINKAARIASAKYIYPCSVDDILYRNDFFYKTINFLEKYKKVDICMTYPSFYDDRYKTFKNQPWILPFKKKAFYSPDEILAKQKKSYFHIWSHSSIYRTKFIKRTLFNYGFKWHSDWYINHKSSLENGILYIPKSFVAFRIFTNNYSANININDQTKVVMKMMDHVLTKENAQIKNKFIESLIFSTYLSSMFKIIKLKKFKLFYTQAMLNRLKYFKYKGIILNIFPVELKFKIKKYIYEKLLNYKTFH